MRLLSRGNSPPKPLIAHAGTSLFARCALLRERLEHLRLLALVASLILLRPFLHTFVVIKFRPFELRRFRHLSLLVHRYDRRRRRARRQHLRNGERQQRPRRHCGEGRRLTPLRHHRYVARAADPQPRRHPYRRRIRWRYRSRRSEHRVHFFFAFARLSVERAIATACFGFFTTGPPLPECRFPLPNSLKICFFWFSGDPVVGMIRPVPVPVLLPMPLPVHAARRPPGPSTTT